MKVIRSLDALPQSGVFTIGNFDGVHRGHVDLLSQVVFKARQKNIPSIVVSFYPHPRKVLGIGDEPEKIYRLSQKITYLSGLGIDYVLLLKFTKDLSKLSHEEFLKRLLSKGSALILGRDARLGAGRKGDSTEIAKWCLANGVEFDAIALKKNLDGDKIGSGAIRTAIKNGQLDKLPAVLGRHYSVSGKVVRGDARGRQIGFPTANQNVPKGLLTPKLGVYASEVRIDGELFSGVTNIGFRPTFHKSGLSPIVETHIFDFSRDIYGKRIEVFLRFYIREEKKFTSKDELIAQIREDCTKAKS